MRLRIGFIALIYPLISPFVCLFKVRGWSNGAKMLDKLSVLGRPTTLDNSRARAYCAAVGAVGEGLGIVFSRLFFSFSLSGRRPDIDSNTVSKVR